MNIPLFKIYNTKEDKEAVEKVIERGSYWAIGPEINFFETELSIYIGTKYSVVFNSGTSALHAILLAYGIKEGDEVIVPSFTFISTANSIKMVGATPVFADIEDTTYGLDFNAVVQKRTTKTKAIILVHYGGCPAKDTTQLKLYCKMNDIILIEDAAGGLGATIKNQKVGTFGDSAMFSFCQSKIITTGGEGGAITTDDPEIYKKLQLIRSHGQFKSDYKSLGYNWRMPSMNAALGLSQLRNINNILSMRDNVARMYDNKLSTSIKTPFIPIDFVNAWWIYNIIVENKNEIQKNLSEKEIFTKTYYLPIHLTTFYKQKVKLPVTEEAYNKLLALPMYPGLKEKEINYIVKCIGEI